MVRQLLARPLPSAGGFHVLRTYRCAARDVGECGIALRVSCSNAGEIWKHIFRNSMLLALLRAYLTEKPKPTFSEPKIKLQMVKIDCQRIQNGLCDDSKSPERSHERSRSPQDRSNSDPKALQERPRAPQEHPKSTPTETQERPHAPRESSRGPMETSLRPF